MSRSQETFNKKEVRKKQEKKRKDKELKRAKKKSEGGKSTFDDMIAYVDEYGKISSIPPNSDNKIVIDAASIELKITKNKPDTVSNYLQKGIVTFFNHSKGYGFIRDLGSNKSVFVHKDNLLEPVREDNVVVYEMNKGPKGYTAINVALFKE